MQTFILVLAVFQTILFIWGVGKINGGMRLTPYFLTSLSLLALSYVGAVMLALGFGSKGFTEIEHKHSLPLFFHVSVIMLLYLLGSAAIGKVHWKPIYFFGQESFEFDFFLRTCMYLLAFGSLLLFAYYWQTLDFNPLVLSLTGDKRDLIILRSLSDYQFTPALHRRMEGWLRPLLIFTSWFFFVRFILRGRRLSDLAWFFVLAFCSSLLLTVHLHKAPIVEYLLFTYLVFLVARNRFLGTRVLIVSALLILVQFPITYYLLGGDQRHSIWTMIGFGMERMFVSQIYPVLLYFDAFPARIPFLSGQALPNPGNLFPHEVFNTGMTLWSIYFGEREDLVRWSVRGSLPAFFPVQWYVNFGLPGLYLSSFFTGAIVLPISRVLMAISYKEIGVPLAFLVGIEFIKLSMTDWTSVFLRYEVLVLVIIVLLALFGAQVYCLTQSRLREGKVQCLNKTT